MHRLTEQVQEELEAARLPLLVALLVEAAIAKPLQRLGPLDDVSRPLGALLELIAVHGGEGRVDDESSSLLRVRRGQPKLG